MAAGFNLLGCCLVDGGKVLACGAPGVSSIRLMRCMQKTMSTWLKITVRFIPESPHSYHDANNSNTIHESSGR